MTRRPRLLCHLPTARCGRAGRGAGLGVRGSAAEGYLAGAHPPCPTSAGRQRWEEGSQASYGSTVCSRCRRHCSIEASLADAAARARAAQGGRQVMIDDEAEEGSSDEGDSEEEEESGGCECRGGWVGSARAAGLCNAGAAGCVAAPGGCGVVRQLGAGGLSGRLPPALKGEGPPPVCMSACRLSRRTTECSKRAAERAASPRRSLQTRRPTGWGAAKRTIARKRGARRRGARKRRVSCSGVAASRRCGRGAGLCRSSPIAELQPQHARAPALPMRAARCCSWADGAVCPCR